MISSVGGQKIPPVDHYIAGYQAGAKAANPKIKTLNGYSQDFVDQAKCKEIALNQIAQGSQVVFQVAGQCGLGALDAAKEKGVQGIGVDADQAYLGAHILTSAQKKVDVAVFDTVKAAPGRHVQGRRRPDLRRQVRRRRPRQDQRRRARSTRTQVDEDQAETSSAGKISDIPTERRSSADGRTMRRCPATRLALELRGITKRFGALVANDAHRLRAAARRDPRPARARTAPASRR